MTIDTAKQSYKTIYSIFEMQQNDFDDFTHWWSDEEKANYTIEGDADFVYNAQGELVCIFEVYKNYILVDYCEDDDAIDAIIKYLYKDEEVEKYKDMDWNWDTIKSPKDDGCYTVAYRGGAGYTYGGGVYNTK